MFLSGCSSPGNKDWNEQNQVGESDESSSSTSFISSSYHQVGGGEEIMGSVQTQLDTSVVRLL